MNDNQTFDFKHTLLSKIGKNHSGKNSILDKGLPFPLYEQYLNSFSKYIQFIKLGWTTWSLFSDSELVNKIDLARSKTIPTCLGGTLFEISYTQGLYDEFLDFISKNKLDYVELASGFAVNFKDLPHAIKKAKEKKLKVMVEIGYKDEKKDNALSIKDRLNHITTALGNGADYIVLEAREQGVGFSVFKKDKTQNEDLVSTITNKIPLDKIIFEAPTRESQIYLVDRLGTDVNMGNISFDEIPRLETIRRRLHANTYKA